MLRVVILLVFVIVILGSFLWLNYFSSTQKTKRAGLKAAQYDEITSNHDQMARTLERITNSDYALLPKAEQEAAVELLRDYYGDTYKPRELT